MPLISRPANLEYLEELIQFVTDHARSNGFRDKRIGEIQLVIEESLVNVMKYAYPETTGEVQVSCTAKNHDTFIVKVIDTGIPFDILSVDDPDTTLEISRRQIGGLGIFFIKSLTNEVCYQREKDKNILTLSFRIERL